MENELNFLKDFVEGKIEIKTFEKELYENENIQKLLEDDSLNWHGTYLKHSPYLYLLELNYNSLYGKLDAQGAVELFLQKKGIKFSKNKQYSDEYTLILDTQPKYLDVDITFIEKYLMPKNKISKDEMKIYIKGKFNEYFKFQNKPPKWIQSPKWIIKNDIPLYFLGQVEIKYNKLFHDNGYVYIFINQETKEIETIMQFY